MEITKEGKKFFWNKIEGLEVLRAAEWKTRISS